jgi:hypothetical protein
MNEIRLKTILSPSLEESLLSNSLSKAEIDSFFNFKDFLSTYSNVLIGILPIELLSYFQYEDRLNIFLSSIKSRNSNILLAPYSSEACLGETSCNDIILNWPDSYFAKVKILSLLSKSYMPFIFNSVKEIITKEECKNCETIFPCRQKLTLETFDPSKVLSDYNEALGTENINKLFITASNLNKNMIKQFFILLNIHFGIEQDNQIDTSCIFFHDDFFSDIKNLEIMKLENLLYSMYRALFFPNIEDQNRHRLSIDWHRNNPYRKLNFCLYRADSIALGRTGNQNSGSDRFLFAEKNSKKYLIAYTENHDFNSSFIESRLRKYI